MKLDKPNIRKIYTPEEKIPLSTYHFVDFYMHALIV